MSTSLPVPSPGALRALRNLALGTSCTVAVSAGLLTEDRRRRIHAARAVQQNGKRIKCSKSYHASAGAVAIAALEEHVLSPEYFTSREHSTEERHLTPPAVTWKSQPIQTHYAHEIPQPLGHTSLLPARGSKTSSEVLAEVQIVADGSLSGMMASINIVLHHIRSGELPHHEPGLVQFCGLIYRQSCAMSNIQAYVPLLQEVLSRGPVSEDVYYSLHAPGTASRLLHLISSRPDKARDAEFLDVALSIFLKPFNEKMHSHNMAILAKPLCRATYRAQMWGKTVEVCKRIRKVPYSNPMACTKFLILALNKLGNHQEAVKYFRSDFVTILSPSNDHLNFVVPAALDSALMLRSPRASEDVVTLSAELAQAHGFMIRAEWFNKALGKQWSYSKDLAKTKATFERLEAFIDVVDLPEAVYSAMMQFCIEGGDEELAYRYFDMHISSTPDIAPFVRSRAFGHLALASAIQGDWNAVKEQIKALLAQATNLAQTGTVSKVFAPIFKLYANAHDVSQSEMFLRKFLEDGLQLHAYTSNVMVNKFAGARDIESLSRWLAEVPHLGIQQDAATCNTLLTTLRDDWALSLQDLVQCVQEIKTRDVLMVNDITFNILEDVIIREAKGNRLFYLQRVRWLESLGITGAATDELENDERTMRALTARGSNVKVLRHYEYAIADESSHVTPGTLDLAIKACLNMGSDNSYEAAVLMLEDGKKKGIDITKAFTRIMLWQIDELIGRRLGRGTEEEVHKIFDSLINRGLKVSTHAIAHVASILCHRGAPSAALMVWEQFVKQGLIEQQDVDLPCLQLLFTTHIHLRSLSGIEYVMRTMSGNKIVPNKVFMAVLKKEKSDLKKSLSEQAIRSGSFRGASGQSRSHELLIVLDSWYERLKAVKAQHEHKSRATAAQLLDIMDQAVKDEESTKLPLQKNAKVAQTEGAVAGAKGRKKEVRQQVEKDVQPASILECPKCHEGKPRADFEKKKFKLGLFNNCRSCRNPTVTEIPSPEAEVPVSLTARQNVPADELVQWRPPISIVNREKKTSEQIEEHRKRVRKRWLDSIHQAQEELEDDAAEDMAAEICESEQIEAPEAQ